MIKEIYHTCEVSKWKDIFSKCELHHRNNKYLIITLQDSEGLFVDINQEIINYESPEISIKSFENICLKRFTCNGEISIEEIKDSGEEICFY